MSLSNSQIFSLQYEFEIETMIRTIQDCNDINLLREIAIQLLELNKQKTAIAEISSQIIFDLHHKKDT